MSSVPAQNLRPLPREGLWVILRALNEVLGEAQFKQVLAQSGLPEIFNKLGNQGREWPDATHNMAGSVTRAVFDMLGTQAYQVLFDAGKAQFRYARANLPMHINMLSSMLKALPRDVRMKMVLEQGSRDLRRSSNGLPVLMSDASAFIVTDVASPTCAGQSSRTAMCVTRIGLLTEAMAWATDGINVAVTETACRATGAMECRFVIPKKF